ncbi:MAG: hypothetical protein GY754_09105 [bacterium]|nr:hypothetical protein [bacterium]
MHGHKFDRIGIGTPLPPLPLQEKTRTSTPEKESEFIQVSLDQGERETLEMIIKEILLYLPMDEESDEELYRSNVPGEYGKDFTLNLYGYEMRALRRFLQKVRHFGSAQRPPASTIPELFLKSSGVISCSCYGGFLLSDLISVFFFTDPKPESFESIMR